MANLAERCEFDPKRMDANQGGHGCDRPALLVVGAHGEWHLCEECAALPFFRRYRRRDKLSDARAD